MLALMIWFLLAVAVLFGFAASRSIVAVSDSHRRGLPDRWSSPVCEFDSFRALNGAMTRCRGADHPQRLANVVVMVATIGLTAAMVIVVPSLWVWPAYAVFVASLVLLTVTDLDTLLIPNRMLGPALIVGGALLTIGWIADTESGSIGRAALGGVAYFTVMYVIAVLAKGGLGFGDVKLAVLIGIFTAYLSWGALLVAGIGSFLIGGLVSVVLLAFGKRGRKDAVPFGPFMVAAALVAVVWGTSIADWYFG